MHDQDDLGNPRRTVYRPTRSSLDFARAIAGRMDRDFDEAEVSRLAHNLYAVMYADLVRLLDLQSPPQLDAASYSLTRVFLALDRERRPTIVLDMIFDFWLFAATHLTSVATFNAMPRDKALHFINVFEAVLNLFVTGAGYKNVRAQVAPYLLDYPRELNISSAMSRAMTVFALCHELAHAECQHLGKPGSREQEDEADREATAYFLRIVRQQETARGSHVYVDPKVAGAPIVMMQLFDIAEGWLEAQSLIGDRQEIHAPAAERGRNIEALLTPALASVAREITEAHGKAIMEIRDALIGD